jgi:hypothetical protein
MVRKKTTKRKMEIEGTNNLELSLILTLAFNPVRICQV